MESAAFDFFREFPKAVFQTCFGVSAGSFSKDPAESQFNLTGTAGRYGSGIYLPFYLNLEKNSQQTIEAKTTRTPNRKGIKPEFGDILHHQKIIVALTETDRLMKEVDEVRVEGSPNL